MKLPLVPAHSVDHTADPTGLRPWWWSYPFLAGVAVVVGAAIRVVRWAAHWSLSTDELFIAINVRRSGFGDLAGVLQYDQIAPVGWLWIERTLVLISPDERVLRLPALVSGVLLLIALAVLAREVLSPIWALVVVVMAAGSPWLIYWSVQVKPYMVEAMLAVVLSAVALRVIRRPTDRRPAVWLWLVAGLAPWLSTPAPFTIAPLVAAVVVALISRRAWPQLRWHGAALAAVATSAGLARWLAPAPPEWVFRFWRLAHPDSLGPDHAGVGAWLDSSLGMLRNYAATPLGVQQSGWVVPCLLVIAVATVMLARDQPVVAMVVAGPFMLAYLVAMVGLYPLSDRVALWLVPSSLLLLAAIPDALPARPMVVLRAVVVFIIFAAIAPGWSRAPQGQAVRYASSVEAVRLIAARQQPGDQVYFRSTSAPVAAWYGHRFGLRWNGTFATAGGAKCRPDPALPRLRNAARLWIVFRAWGRDTQAIITGYRATMARYGAVVEEHRFGAFVVLLGSIGPGPAPGAGSRCLVLRSDKRPQPVSL